MDDGFGHVAECHEGLLSGVELAHRKAASRVHPLWVWKRWKVIKLEGQLIRCLRFFMPRVGNRIADDQRLHALAHPIEVLPLGLASRLECRLALKSQLQALVEGLVNQALTVVAVKLSDSSATFSPVTRHLERQASVSSAV